MGRGGSPIWKLKLDCRTRNYMRWRSNQTWDLALQTEGKLLSQLICYILSRSQVGRNLLEFCKAYLAQWAICKLYSSASSSKVFHNPLVRGRCWIEGATPLDTGRAIIQTAQLGIILHAACNAWPNVIITFFMPFDPAHVTRKVVQNTRPSFCFSGRVWAWDYNYTTLAHPTRQLQKGLPCLCDITHSIDVL